MTDNQSDKPILILDANALICGSEQLDALRLQYQLSMTKTVGREVKDSRSRRVLDRFKTFIRWKTPSSLSMQRVRAFAAKTGDNRVLSDADIGVVALAVDFLKATGNDHLLNTKVKPQQRLDGFAKIKSTTKNKKKKNKKKKPQSKSQKANNHSATLNSEIATKPKPKLMTWDDTEEEQNLQMVLKPLQAKLNNNNIGDNDKDNNIIDLDDDDFAPLEKIDGPLAFTQNLETEVPSQDADSQTAQTTLTSPKITLKLSTETSPNQANDEAIQEDQKDSVQTLQDLPVPKSQNQSSSPADISQTTESKSLPSNSDKPINQTSPNSLSDETQTSDTQELTETELANLGWVSKSQDVSSNMQQDDYADGWVGPDNFATWETSQHFSSASTKDRDQDFISQMRSRLELTKVGIVSGDFAVQNISLQMGIPLLSTTGKVVARLKSYVLECFSCSKLERDCSVRFCSGCGKDTLSRVTCEFGPDNQVTLFKKKHYRFHRRGLRYNIPDPKGGRKINELLLTQDCFAQPKVQAFLRKKKFHERQSRKGIEEHWDVGGVSFENSRKGNKNFFDLDIGYGRKNPNVNSFWKKKGGAKKKNRKRGKKRN
ncbi:MAG: hypothetical protein AAFO91_04070 [Bacteroidota bacterium]